MLFAYSLFAFYKLVNAVTTCTDSNGNPTTCVVDQGVYCLNKNRIISSMTGTLSLTSGNGKTIFVRLFKSNASSKSFLTSSSR